MARSVNSDPLTATIKRHCEFEKEMYVDQVRFGPVQLDCRCKYDAWAPALGYGFDLKTTTAKTQAEFLAASRKFSYPRARVFYCTIAGASRDIIIGVSKHPPHRIFKIFLQPGDLLWKEGEAELMDLTMKYWALKIPA
jgi:hypothetical protein